MNDTMEKKYYEYEYYCDDLIIEKLNFVQLSFSDFCTCL